MSAATITEQFTRADYQRGYFGPARRGGEDRETYERGMIARRVAEWCGVDLSGSR